MEASWQVKLHTQWPQREDGEREGWETTTNREAEGRLCSLGNHFHKSSLWDSKMGRYWREPNQIVVLKRSGDLHTGINCCFTQGSSQDQLFRRNLSPVLELWASAPVHNESHRSQASTVFRISWYVLYNLHF